MNETPSESKIVEPTQIVPQKTESAPVTPQPQQVVQPVQEEETPQQIDWKRFKEARKLERQQKEEAEKRAAAKAQEAEALKAAMEALLNKPTAAAQAEETDDDRIQRKIDQALAAERIRVQKENREREDKEIPHRLQQMYPDFDQVCSEENKDYLKFHYPEVYDSFDKMPHSLDTYATIYKGMKRLIPNTASHQDQKKAEKNAMKPQSMSVPGTTQRGDAHPVYKLDEARKKANWERMQRNSKGLVSG